MGTGGKEDEKEGLSTIGKACTSCSPTSNNSQSPFHQEGPHPTRAQTYHQERRLPPSTSTIAIRDSINTALQATFIQCVESNPANDLLLITKDTVNFFFFFFLFIPVP